MANKRKPAAKASTAANKKAPAKTTPIVEVSTETESTDESEDPMATCFAVAKAPSPKKKLYWAGFSVVKQVDGAEISADLAGTEFQRESQAAFAWSKSTLASLDKKSFSAAALENHLGLDFGDY